MLSSNYQLKDTLSNCLYCIFVENIIRFPKLYFIFLENFVCFCRFTQFNLLFFVDILVEKVENTKYNKKTLIQRQRCIYMHE